MVALPIGDEGGVHGGVPGGGSAARFSSGHLVMIVAGLLGMVLGIAALRHEPGGVEVAVAAHEIRAGETRHRRRLPHASACRCTDASCATFVRAAATSVDCAVASRPPRSRRVSRSSVASCGRVRRGAASGR